MGSGFTYGRKSFYVEPYLVHLHHRHSVQSVHFSLYGREGYVAPTMSHQLQCQSRLVGCVRQSDLRSRMIVGSSLVETFSTSLATFLVFPPLPLADSSKEWNMET